MNGAEFLTIAELTRLLRFDATAPSKPEIACRQWLRRQAVPVLKRGRTLLVERRVIDAILRGYRTSA